MHGKHLDELESISVHIIREAYQRFQKAGLLWSMGKDSTALLWLCRKAFFGKIPFPVIHIDTSYKIGEIYRFRAKWAKQWKLPLVISKNEEALETGMNHKKGVLNCCGALKTDGLKMAIHQQGLKAVFLAIRRDEHGIRAKERYVSPRNEDFQWKYWDQPAELWGQFHSALPEHQHYRVHPMLDWTELDVWRYIEREKMPVIGLYFAKDGKRYRSIGCAPCTIPVDSKSDTIKKIIRELQVTKTSERSGRAQDKESAFTMQKLRSLGYM